MSIKIFSGWSNPGGSTTAHINLCNLFNDNGQECIFYGPHSYHLDKCKAEMSNKLQFNNNDTLIIHFNYLPSSKLPVKKVILSCHETDLYPTGKMNLNYVNMIHFVSESQKQWHNTCHASVVIPNIISDIRPKTNGKLGIAGIIGSVDHHKQTHLSIERALADGYNKILVFGAITDQHYYKLTLEPLCKLHKNKIEFKGFIEDKNIMYNSVDEVYHSSLRETFNYIKFECKLAGVKYNGLPSADSSAEMWPKEQIFSKWMEVING
jgi:hypothetical protein